MSGVTGESETPDTAQVNPGVDHDATVICRAGRSTLPALPDLGGRCRLGRLSRSSGPVSGH